MLIGVASTPLRRPEAEQVLIGAPPGADVIDAAVAAAVEGLTPASDVHGSSTYRRHLAGVLAGRAIRAALANAEEKA